MFCSNCGKSLNPEDDKCPHCGAAIGESRFDGSLPYTGAQEKLRPGKAVRSYGKHYTTDFVVGGDGEQQLPSDSDSAYRAAVGIDNRDNQETRLYNAYEDDEDERVEREEEREEKHTAFGFRFLRRDKSEDEPEENEEIPENEEIGEDGLTETERRMITAEDDFTPIRPVGISEDLSAYLQRQSENERREKERRDAHSSRTPEKEEELSEEEITEELLRAEKPAKKSKAKKSKQKPEKADKADKKSKRNKTEKDKSVKDEPDTEETTEKEKSGIKLPFGLFRKKEENFDDESFDVDSDEAFGDDTEDFEDEAPKKKRLKFSLPKKKTKSEKKKEEPIEEPDDETDDDVEYGEEEYNLDKLKKNRLTLIKNIAIVAAALVVIVAAVIGVSGVREKSKTAPIETVTLSLWNDGISVMEGRVKDSYRKSMLALYDKSNPATYLTLQAAFTRDLDGLTDLMPEAPMQHDQVFINALKAIQESINNCLSNDALSMTDGTKTAAEKDAESALRWESVQEILTMLKNSTNVGQLEAIIKGERVELIQNATPTAEPTATPAPYTTLAKGAKGLAVSNLQSRLSELGYLNASIDGDYGNKTKTAVEKFQQAAGLSVTGIADVETQEMLYSDNAPKAK